MSAKFTSQQVVGDVNHPWYEPGLPPTNTTQSRGGSTLFDRDDVNASVGDQVDIFWENIQPSFDRINNIFDNRLNTIAAAHDSVIGSKQAEFDAIAAKYPATKTYGRVEAPADADEFVKAHYDSLNSDIAALEAWRNNPDSSGRQLADNYLARLNSNKSAALVENAKARANALKDFVLSESTLAYMINNSVNAHIESAQAAGTGGDNGAAAYEFNDSFIRDGAIGAELLTVRQNTQDEDSDINFFDPKVQNIYRGTIDNILSPVSNSISVAQAFDLPQLAAEALTSGVQAAIDNELKVIASLRETASGDQIDELNVRQVAVEDFSRRQGLIGDGLAGTFRTSPSRPRRDLDMNAPGSRGRNSESYANDMLIAPGIPFFSWLG